MVYVGGGRVVYVGGSLFVTRSGGVVDIIHSGGVVGICGGVMIITCVVSHGIDGARAGGLTLTKRSFWVVVALI